MLADAGDRPIAIDIETAALPEYADYPPMRLTTAGRPNKVQPRSDNQAALDPHRSETRLVQLAPVWKHPLVAHNVAFELKFLAAVGIKPRLQCTERAVKLLSGVPEAGIWGLADACQAYLGVTVPKTRNYLQIVESRRTDGAVRQHVVATLGRAEDWLEVGKLDQLLQSGARLSETALVLSAVRDGEVLAVDSRRIGAPLIFERRETGCQAVIETLLASTCTICTGRSPGWVRNWPTRTDGPGRRAAPRT